MYLNDMSYQAQDYQSVYWARFLARILKLFCKGGGGLFPPSMSILIFFLILSILAMFPLD